MLAYTHHYDGVMCREKTTDIQIYTSLLCQYVWTCGSTAMEIDRATGATLELTLAVQNWFSIFTWSAIYRIVVDWSAESAALYEKSSEWSRPQREREKLRENSPTMKSPLNLFRLVDASGERLKKSCKLLKTLQAVFHLFACQKSSSSSSPHSDNMKRAKGRLKIFQFSKCLLLLWLAFIGP